MVVNDGKGGGEKGEGEESNGKEPFIYLCLLAPCLKGQ